MGLLRIIMSNQHRWAGVKVLLVCTVIGAGLLVYSPHYFGRINFSESSTEDDTQLTPRTTGGDNYVIEITEVEKVQYRSLNLNMSAPSHQLWPNDSLCDRVMVRPAYDLSPTWLLSFPRSGNTWTRYLIEAATGVFTTSIYHDNVLVRLDFQGELENIDAGTTVLRKTHDSRWIKNTSDPVILLVRDPRRAIVSFWSSMSLRGHKDQYKIALSEKAYRTPAFHLFVWTKTLEWSRMITKATENYKNMMTLYYEDLLQDPIGEVRRILKFLKIRPDEGRLECLTRHLEGPFKSAKKVQDPFNAFEKKVLESATKGASESLVSKGFSPLPNYKL